VFARQEDDLGLPVQADLATAFLPKPLHFVARLSQLVRGRQRFLFVREARAGCCCWFGSFVDVEFGNGRREGDCEQASDRDA